ncbi:MAG: hypothetical protein ABIV51_02735 [Saprospiraceae bacterium]
MVRNTFRIFCFCCISTLGSTISAQNVSGFSNWYEALAEGKSDSILVWYQLLPASERIQSKPVLLYAEALNRSNQVDQAIDLLDELKTSDSLNGEFRDRLAELYMQELLWEKAYVHYSSLLNQFPKVAKYWRKMGDISLQVDQNEAASYYYSQAHIHDVYNPEYTILYAKSLVNLDKLDSALQLIQKNSALFPNNRSYQFYLAELLYRNSSYQSTVQILDRFTQLPNYYQMISGLSWIQLDSFQRGMDILVELPEKLLQHEVVQGKLAHACLQLGDTTKAMVYFEGALEAGISKNSAIYYLEKAKVYLQLNNLPQAKNAVYKGMSIKRLPELVWYNAKISELQGQLAQAKTSYSEFIQMADSTQLNKLTEAQFKLDSLSRN